MSKIRVLVTGASIAGPALAHWLHRRGAEVTVVERSPGLRPGGQAVDARGVAKEAIRRMGLDARCGRRAPTPPGVHGGRGRERAGDLPRGGPRRRRVHLRDRDPPRRLRQVLYDDTRDDVEYVFGDRVAELIQDADGVDVTFASGDVGASTA